MALMFPRLARNFIKNGYFPTDDLTLAGILGALEADGPVRLLDPCCGEGSALAEVKHHLQAIGAEPMSLGVEYDAERAWHAKGWLDQVIHADVNDVVIGQRSVGLLFLNPPYGDALSDRAMLSTGHSGRKERLEKQFYRMAMPWLAFGGVLVFIVPHYVLDAELSAMLARHLHQVQVFLAPEQRFRQIVLFGVKRRSDSPDTKLAARLEAIGRGELPEILPTNWHLQPYRVPPAPAEALRFQAIRIDGRQLADELGRTAQHTLWPQFDHYFGARTLPHRRPLCEPSDWHLAYALAAGQLSGEVSAPDGRRFLITGDTYKERTSQVAFEENDDGDLVEVRTLTDKFVPVIVALDFTPGPGYGDVVTIR
ncbi:DUF6094 domain-containing protein [Chitinimonas koreensis]|nr:DUF6094 domain-containing protein [Chitinimonas koreensis]QNM95501.1 SAM-dependent methyltransferase [Chitinimonas koreensis]